MFGAVLVCFLRRKLCFLKLQKLTPKNLQIHKHIIRHPSLFSLFSFFSSTHLNLLVAGWELPLLEDEDVVTDPLQQHGDQLVILLPAQLQLLTHTHRQLLK